MQFQVPQFIDIEDRIIGPLTLKQFLYLGGGAGLAYLAYTYIGIKVGFIFIALFILLGISLAFWKPNNRPAIIMLQAFFKHYTKSRMYVWQRPQIRNRKTEPIKIIKQENIIKNVDYKKIESLAWSLDTMDRKQK
jgi:hypothetical protein